MKMELQLPLHPQEIKPGQSPKSLLDVTLCFNLLLNEQSKTHQVLWGEKKHKLQFIKVLTKLDHRFNPTP